MADFVHHWIDQDGVATLQFDDPATRNAMTCEMAAEARSALDLLAADERTRFLVLTGSNGAFCSGANIWVLHDWVTKGVLVEEEFKQLEAVHALTLALWRFPRPTMAMIPGPATGGGLEISLACDLRTSADTAVFGETFIRVGLPLGDGGYFLLPRVIGWGRAMEMAYTGDLIKADMALSWGLINRVWPAEELVEQTFGWVHKIARFNPDALRVMKNGFRSVNPGYEEGLDFIRTNCPPTLRSPGHAAAIKAFIDRSGGK